MDSTIVTAIISGTFSLVAAFGSIWFKYWLDQQGKGGKERAPEPEIPDILVSGPQSPTGKVSTPKPVSVPQSRTFIFRPILILFTGFLFGFLMEALQGTLLDTGSSRYNWGFLFFLALCILCLVLVFRHRRLARGFWSYQLDAVVLWAAGLFGFSLAHRSLWSDAVASFVIVWFISALVGGIIILITRKKAS